MYSYWTPTGITLILRKGVGPRNVWWLHVAAIGKPQNNITIISCPTSASSSLCSYIISYALSTTSKSNLCSVIKLCFSCTCVWEKMWNSICLIVVFRTLMELYHLPLEISVSIPLQSIHSPKSLHTYSPLLCTLYKSYCAHIVITLIWLA